MDKVLSSQDIIFPWKSVFILLEAFLLSLVLCALRELLQNSPLVSFFSYIHQVYSDCICRQNGSTWREWRSMTESFRSFNQPGDIMGLTCYDLFISVVKKLQPQIL
jgi:hypothetical protein